jgi:hypothetical protein
MPVRRLLAPVAALLAAASTVAAASALAPVGQRSGAAADPRGLDEVEFVSVCQFSHRAANDPIVHPRRPGRSHDHSFFGNVSTDAFSTARSLRDEPTTCHRSEDTAAYWAPTLIRDDRAVTPLEAKVYYRRRTLAPVRAFPPGLEMIAGDAHAVRPQSRRVTFWDCGEHARVAPSSTVPTCPAGTANSLRLNVRFPDCWDGRRIDSADHKRHVAYSAGGRCPASHPVALPSITLVVQYPTAGGRGLGLASGGQLSGHADFVNAWQQGGLTRLVDYCLNALRVCGAGS